MTPLALAAWALPSKAQTPTAGDLSTEPIELSQVELSQLGISRNAAGISRNFIGIGGNIGFDDDSTVGDSGFAVISKLSLSDNISIRPAAVIDNDVTFIVPVTYNFVNRAVGVADRSLVPYVGAGVAITTDDDSDVSGLISAGADFPISDQFTANGQANLSIGDETGFSILLGVGYNFGGL
ncbi:MAG: hypothetical protein HC886_23375 [Leptolyngbyaceae cyanobacterium SM1_1_3]|nr:hypothetical protein [Leptolyngbyaceae cyanobacterium SM1_1_3]NJM85577.1 hypothetical protein [Leptolyngbyaceae cyanobacterium RM2_2_21]NJN04591.1 hypothetical protein [Leptolyngbyaceae cyanobacterium RM1_1_2]NJO11918.1 hypothetical protein [Leptolyngbyaceae cyanobacterium SL_1_1]